MTEKRICGTGVSAGIAFGRAYVYIRPLVSEVAGFIGSGEVAGELQRLKNAGEKSMRDLRELVELAGLRLGQDQAAILAVQQTLMTDPAFIPEMEKLIVECLYPAERAVMLVVERIAALFTGLTDKYMQERAADIRDAGRQILSHLQGENGLQLPDDQGEVILVADDLMPSETIRLDKKHILGFVTRIGGKTSHTAILARSMGISAVVGAGKELAEIKNGDALIIDGSSGECIINPNPGTVTALKQKVAIAQASRRRDLTASFKPAVTLDGFRVRITANIGMPAEAEAALAGGAEGVGLFRTEILFMHGARLPDEEEQYHAYKKVVEIMGDKPVTVRTLDVGGDKKVPGLPLPEEMNPVLGWRGIRLCLDQREIFSTQLRAILRAGMHGKIRIMLPLVSGLAEWRQAMGVYEEVRSQLGQAGVAFDRSVALGMMMETPAAALMADRFAGEADFFSIGTNDLVQYTLAVDRMNEKIALLYDYFHPAIICLLTGIVKAAHSADKKVSICGEMAGDPLAAPLLIGLGLDEWSMAAGVMGNVKKVITGLRRSDCERLVERIRQADTGAEVRQQLAKFSIHR